MGNAVAGSVKDMNGAALEIGDWVECTKARTADITTSLGYISNITGTLVTLEWTLWGTTIYDQEDMTTWGIRKVLVDVGGAKIAQNQLVANEKGVEALVTAVTDSKITLWYSAADSAEYRSVTGSAHQETLDQKDILSKKIKVRAAILTRNQRGCTRRCM
mmetsp:Transcript_64204/g.134957  ORF Transcript_64204/g.134957 Transcript_64204/m.134957 type:complete len:160 (+) Transcript_64204:212-691(+)